MMRGLLCTVLLLATGCGDPAEAFELSVGFPGYLALEGCDMPASQRSALRAVLEIGGHEDAPCTLTLDPTTLASSGVCGRITPGIVRPIGLAYSAPDPTNGRLHTLAYLVGWVDLRQEALDPAATEVSVSLNPDGVNGTQIDTDAEYDALPTQTAAEREGDSARRELLKAEAWAKERLALVDFDLDHDTDSNLLEACAGTLF